MNIKLSTGTEISALAGIIGIDEFGDVFHGYDGRIFSHDHADPFDTNMDLTSIEQIELAHIMLSRWFAFLSRAQRED